jgi:hypothetical protein
MSEQKTPLQQLEELTDVQSTNGNWNWDYYMMGLANGLILALHTMRGDQGEVPYKSKPDEWLCDRYERLKAQGFKPESVLSEPDVRHANE